MISKSERLLIFRFLFSKKSDGYVSIFAWFSIIGISLGVAAIIIVMSVMNGFRIDLTNRIIGLNSHLNIYSFDNEITNKQADELIFNIDNSFFYQHYKSIETNGLIIKLNNSKGVMIKGYDEYDKNHYLFNSINMGALIQSKGFHHIAEMWKEIKRDIERLGYKPKLEVIGCLLYTSPSPRDRG